jgi:argininosuccinate synthase
VIAGYVLAASVVLPWWLSVASGTIAPVSDVPPEDPRDALIREQAQRIAALEAVVADLREQLAAAVRAGSRNSGNSSMPPSSDDLPGRKPPRK